MFFQVNETPDEIKVPVVTTRGWAEACTRLAKRALRPGLSTCQSYTELTALFKDHLSFRDRRRVGALPVTGCAKAQTCDYGNFLQDALRDQFVAGIHDQSLRKKLLTESMLTFEKACTIAKAYEAA
ncbi:hypothetical protein pipiens_006857 [Culex pipiens pipiens]|uniref:Uncharacterized protein n=1 Tax=Culex pipiens pipiens TaxID=38569 RepID=A0ABD1DNZ7_CULPP